MTEYPTTPNESLADDLLPRVSATHSPEPSPIFSAAESPFIPADQAYPFSEGSSEHGTTITDQQTTQYTNAATNPTVPVQAEKIAIGGKLLGAVVVSSMILGAVTGGAASMAIMHFTQQTTPVVATADTLSQPASVTQSSVVVQSVSEQASSVVKKISPAVVTIVNTEQPQVTDMFGNVAQPVATGSGVIIDNNGDILTNNHVIANEASLKIIFSNGKQAVAQFVGADPSADLAVVKVNLSVPAVAPLGNSDALQPGQTVLAIGSALGDYQNTVTEGIISAVDRTISEPLGDGSTNMLHHVLQTDAAINHGNSGGPLVDLTGHVVGINTAIVRSSSATNNSQSLFPDVFNSGTGSTDTAEGLGFAISSNTARATINRLLQNNPAAYLGVRYSLITPQESSSLGLPVGALVNTISPDSPAAQCGLHVHDVITAIDGQILDTNHQLSAVIGTHKPGDTVTLTINRAARTLTLKTALGSRSAH